MIKSSILLVSQQEFDIVADTEALIVGFIYTLILALIPTVFILSFSALFNRRGGMVYALIADIVLSILFFADAQYARGFERHLLSVVMLSSIRTVNGTGDSILGLLKWYDAVYFIDIPFLIIMVVKNKDARHKRNIPAFLLMLILPAAIMTGAFIALENKSQLNDTADVPLSLSPLGYHFYDIYLSVRSSTREMGTDDRKEIETWFKANSVYSGASGAYSNMHGILSGKNVIAIQMESFEHFLIGYEYNGEPVTPTLNRLAAGGLYFDGVYQQVNDGSSADAELMFLTSLYPLPTGCTFVRYGDNAFYSLPKALEQRGYITMALHGDNRSFWGRDVAYASLGFDRYIDEAQFTHRSEVGMGVSDDCMFAQMEDELERLTEPYFLFAISLTTHTPFELPDELRQLTPDDDSKDMDYLQSMRYFDSALGEFVDDLEESGRLEDTVLVLYGDHEGIHRYYDEESMLEENNKRLPFIIYGGGLEPETVETVGGQVDMLPTLLWLMGCESKYNMGRNLLTDAPGSVILSDGTVIGEGDELLDDAQRISELCITGNYFAR